MSRAVPGGVPADREYGKFCDIVILRSEIFILDIQSPFFFNLI
jgi:hypothetical protein